MTEFQGFAKIARLSREVIVTEKIDGTNAQVFIGDDGEFLAGSRTRWITPENDNYGFARWAYAHREELDTALGPGRHFGEWWGGGIQRGYGLKGDDKRFSLFNVTRWCLHGATPAVDARTGHAQEVLPPCVGLVPVLWRGNFDDLDTKSILASLSTSVAAPGFTSPEGIVIFHMASGALFKKTIHNDDTPKSMR